MTIEEKLDAKLAEYAKRFGDGFPMYQLGRGRSDEEIIDLVDKCLKAGKDAYEMGLVEDDEDLDY